MLEITSYHPRIPGHPSLTSPAFYCLETADVYAVFAIPFCMNKITDSFIGILGVIRDICF